MTVLTLRKALIGLCALTVAAGLAAAQPTSTKTTAKTGSTSETKEITGTVLMVDGQNLVVKLSSGEIKHLVVPEGRTARIDGKDVAARDLKVGTKLKATTTTTTTSVVDRTVTVGSGKVWYVAGNNVILTFPNGENHQYKVASDYKFIVDGKPATVFELRKGMRVSAEKIVEEPRTVVAANTMVTGEAPAAAAPAPAPAPVAAAPRKATPPPAPRAEPAPAPAPAPAPEPAKLPKTGSLLPLIGIAGALFTALGARSLRRR